uniref:peptidylprolyl isomerase n=1 Tax=Aureoumbra lagunensis TaxID=44058 RepID=A0A7S3JX45_9STRA
MEEEPNEIDAEGYRELMPGVRYKEIESGKGEQVEYKQAVICSLEGKLISCGTIFEKFERKMLRVGDGDVPPGLELGLRQLREGTKCQVRAEWRFAYGEHGRPGSKEENTMAIPPKAQVEWSIKCHRLWFREADETMTPAEALEDARNKKILGNEHFHHENWRKAASNYQDILKNLNPWNYQEEERNEAETLYVDCGNNLVIALIKLDEWLKSERAVCDVLTVAPENKKALYRAIQISLHLSKWPESQAALQIAIEKWPNSIPFREQYKTLQEHKRKYKQRKSKISAQMSKQLITPSSASSSSALSTPSATDFSMSTATKQKDLSQKSWWWWTSVAVVASSAVLFAALILV